MNGMHFLSIFLRPHSVTSGDALKPLPWIDEEIIRFEWEKISDKYLLRPSSSLSQPVQFKIDPKAFEKITSHNLSQDISNLTYETYGWFREALRSDAELERFSEWWKALATRNGGVSQNGKLFQFDFHQGPWEIPWELLFGLLVLDETRKRTAIVRCIGHTENECKGFRTEALKILIIKSDAPELTIDKDVDKIISIWDGLEQKFKLAVPKPKVIKADRTTIIQELHNYKPHMIWFVGHGYFDGVFHLVFSKNDSTTAAEFAELFDFAGHCPEFAVFWACESSRGSLTLHSEQPDLFAALSSKGVCTMVGMQSEVAEDAATVMATQLLRGIVQGLPLEWAISRARTWMYTINGEETNTMDWAAPVVWTVKRPVAQLNWNQTELDHLQLQLLGTASIERGQPGEAGLDVDPPDDKALTRARDWLPFSITIVDGNPESAEHKLWFLHTLKGIQTISENAVLVITPWKSSYHKKNFQNWAKGFLESLEKTRLPEEFFTRIDILNNDAEIGWRRLCSLENAFLAVIDPPPASEDWFWIPFFELPGRRAVLTGSEIPDRFKEHQVNRVMANDEIDSVEISQIEAAIHEHSQLLAVLSLLNIPIRTELLIETNFGSDPTDLFRRWSKLFIKSFGGYVIRAAVREKVLAATDGEKLFEARLNCLRLTNRMGQWRKPYLKELRVELLLDNNDKDAAVIELSDLLQLYRDKQETIPLLRAAMNKKYFQLKDGLTAWEWLQYANVFVQLGEQRQAKYWLSRESENILDVPLKLSLEAEVKKNDGDIDGARILIEKAIDACKKNQNSNDLTEVDRQKAATDYLRYRHDRARLLHFQERNFSEAAKEYREIIETVEALTSSQPKHILMDLLAVAHRNLGECILDLNDGPLEDSVRREADSHYQSALGLEKQRNPTSHLISEIYYQLAKLAEKQSQPVEIIRQELNNCVASAEESHHGLMAAIAKNWLLWLDVKERNLKWNDIAQKWELVADSLRGRREHSWSARTLLNSNIEAARLLMNEEPDGLSQERLDENLGIIRGNSFLRRRGDLVRIIKTLAGLQILADRRPDKQDYWKLLQSEFAEAGKLAQALGWSTPQEAW